MKNIKNNLFYVIIILSALNSSMTQSAGVLSAEGGKEAAKALGESLANGFKNIDPTLGKQAAATLGDKLADGLQHIDPTLGNQAAGTLGDSLGDKLKEAAPTVALEAAAKLAPALEVTSIAASAGVAIYGTFKLVSTATDVYNHFNPDEEKIARINEAREKNEYFDAKRGLRTCLMNNAWKPRNDAGIPTVCENFSRTFRMIAGKAALDEMTTNFKNAYQE